VQAPAFGGLGFGLLIHLPMTAPVWRSTNAGIILLLVSELIGLAGQTASLGVDQMLDGEALSDVLGSSFGRLLGFRVAAALLLWVVTGSLHPAPGPNSEAQIPNSVPPTPNSRLTTPLQPPVTVAAALSLAVSLAVIDAFGQHAASFSPQWLGIGVHAIHLLAMSLWLGGAVALVIARPQIRTLKLAGFGGAALFAIVASGLALAYVHVGTLLSLPNSSYGQILGIKQIFFLLAIGAGWLALRKVGRGWALAETSALLGLIALAGLLVSLPPPR
jgi:putative copper export protein